MRLLNFRIQNYRSITDSGLVTLSSVDNITVLAGQNESGKSSILSALRDFKNATFDPESAPFTIGDSLEQSVSCAYAVDEPEELIKRLSEKLVIEFKLQIPESESVLDENKIKTIKKFTLTRTKKEDLRSFSIDAHTYAIFQSALKLKFEPKLSAETINLTLEDSAESDLDNKTVNGEISMEVVAELFFCETPIIVYFDDFCDLLPNKILLSDLSEKKSEVEGYKAVSNLAELLKVDFVKKDSEPDPVRRTKESKDNDTLSIDFQQDWGQRIHGENKVLVEYNFEKREGAGADGSYINFFVQTKTGQPLPPKKRSKGLIWFLSLWLELKALDAKNSDLVLLLDEPDQHLHVKAQNDILKLINKLAKNTEGKGDQIIYATHSPYLIEAQHLNRIKLVINDEKFGTKVEDILASKINTDYRRDALQPISDAIGLSVSEFSTLTKRNVLVEGVSDFYYFMAMKKMLNQTANYNFVPGVGVRQINNLISLCIGYGLEWCAIIDDDPSIGGKDSKKKFDEIADYIFDGDVSKTKEKVHILEGIVGIENVFSAEDLKLTGIQMGKSSDMVKAVGKKRKILVSRAFYEKVESGEISENMLSKKTISVFSKTFEYIRSALDL